MRSEIDISNKWKRWSWKDSCVVPISPGTGKKGDTGLSDLDVDSSNVAKIMNVELGEAELTEDRKIVPIQFNENLKINSLSAMLSDSTISQSGAQYRRIAHDILLTTEWGDLDYMIMDMPPSSGDIFREVVDITKKTTRCWVRWL